MSFIVAALVGGLVLGLVRGGRLRNLADVTFRAWPVLALGAAVQLLVEGAGLGGGVGFALVLVSYGLLVAFAVANLVRPGMPLVLLGILLNALVIAVNGGMPVKAEAIVAAGLADTPAEARALDFGGKRHVAGPDDRLLVLGDVLPVPIGAGEVLSYGDLVLALGAAGVLADAMTGARRRRSSADQAGEVPVEGVERRPDGGVGHGVPGGGPEAALAAGAEHHHDPVAQLVLEGGGRREREGHLGPELDERVDGGPGHVGGIGPLAAPDDPAVAVGEMDLDLAVGQRAHREQPDAGRPLGPHHLDGDGAVDRGTGHQQRPLA